MYKVKECKMVLHGDPSRVCYPTAWEALTQASKLNAEEKKKNEGDETFKFHMVRWCPSCLAWHLTTTPEKKKGGVYPPTYKGGDSITLIVCEDTGTASEISSLADEAEKVKLEMDFAKFIKSKVNVGIFDSNISKVAHLYWRVTDKNYYPDLTDEERDKIHEIILNRRFPMDIYETVQELKEPLEQLKTETDYQKKGRLISFISKLERENVWMWNLGIKDLTDFYWEIEDQISQSKG